MIPVNLFTTFYRERDTQRYNELIFSLSKNMKAGFDHIHIICDDEETSHEVAYEAMKIAELNKEENEEYHQKLVVDFVSRRVVFNDIFAAMRKEQYKGAINIMANTDIFFENLHQFRNHFQLVQNPGTHVLALSRWDWKDEGEAYHFERSDSQDSWCFFGSPNVVTSIEFGFGIAGNDNRLAYELSRYGYDLSNPSKTIKTFHVHNSPVRNYVGSDGLAKDRVPPPYQLVHPF